MLFPTDNEAAAVAEGLGVAFFRHESFGSFPKEEAKNYGDNTFVQMMWIKVLCVYLPLNLGYHVLFQDADIVWLKDPIHEYFLKPEVAGDFDVWFQDDGSRSTRFGPYFSNSGFYFLKHNLRTRQFMNALLFSGDAIIELRSHQSALVQVLADSSSRYGLKVKTLSYADFPSGKEFHHRMPYMKAWMKGTEVRGLLACSFFVVRILSVGTLNVCKPPLSLLIISPETKRIRRWLGPQTRAVGRRWIRTPSTCAGRPARSTSSSTYSSSEAGSCTPPATRPPFVGVPWRARESRAPRAAS